MEPLNNPNQNTGTKGKGLIFTQKKKEEEEERKKETK
jgi:hypothetical protein